jgi:hypothetical protein
VSSHLSFEERLRQCLDQESLLKLDILSRKKHLSDLFLEQVQNPDPKKATFTEEEFWRNNEAAIVEEIGQSRFQQILKFKIMQNQVSGLENRPILFVPEQNIKENVPDLKINKAQAQRLIYEFADLRQAYESKPNRQSEEEFWPDVNFVKNLQDGRSSPRNEDGFGTYRKKYDADAFQAIHRDCDNDRALIKMKDQQDRQMQKARKVIDKYNKNSDRILQSMGCQRKDFDQAAYLDEELLRKAQAS